MNNLYTSIYISSSIKMLWYAAGCVMSYQCTVTAGKPIYELKDSLRHVKTSSFSDELLLPNNLDRSVSQLVLALQFAHLALPYAV